MTLRIHRKGRKSAKHFLVFSWRSSRSLRLNEDVSVNQ